MNPTVYRHYDKFGNLLYVGCTTDPEARLSGHKSVSSWFKQIARIEMEHFDTRQQALAEEDQQTATTPELERIVWQEAQKYEASIGK